ncbi:MAG: hypothetical protein LBR78_03000, partial [Holosporales bacterium]|nr:hypothetical protein [Holosporales bacterium]
RDARRGTLHQKADELYERIDELAEEVGARGSAGSVHERLGALEDETTGVARADDLAALAARVGTSDDTSEDATLFGRQQAVADEIGTHEDTAESSTVHGRLTALEDETTGVARANDLAALAEKVGTSADAADAETLYGRLQAIEDGVDTIGSSDGPIQTSLDALVAEVGVGGDGVGSIHDRLSALESEIGVGGEDVGSIHDRLGAMESALGALGDGDTEVAREKTLLALAAEVGGRGEDGDTVHEKLDAIQTTLSGMGTGGGGGTPTDMALQSTLAPLALAVGTLDPLTGMHLWISNTFGLMVAQARAERMLGVSAIFEPWRTVMKTIMTRSWSTLRPDCGPYATQDTYKTQAWNHVGYGTVAEPATYILMAHQSTGAQLIALIGDDGTYTGYRWGGSSYVNCQDKTTNNNPIDLIQTVWYDTWYQYEISLMRVPGVWVLGSTAPEQAMKFQLKTDVTKYFKLQYGEANPSLLDLQWGLGELNCGPYHRIIGRTV